MEAFWEGEALEEEEEEEHHPRQERCSLVSRENLKGRGSAVGAGWLSANMQGG